MSVDGIVQTEAESKENQVPLVIYKDLYNTAPVYQRTMHFVNKRKTFSSAFT